MHEKLTQSRLKKLVHYNLETGVFTWLKRENSQWNGKWAKKRAGWIRNGKSGIYRQISVDDKKYYEHRLAWLYVTGNWPVEIDHINGDKVDNKFCNLREAHGSQNHYNKTMSNNTSGYKGVFFCNQKKKWLARIQANKKQIHLGTFKTPEDAHSAYCIAADKYHGGFARTA